MFLFSSKITPATAQEDAGAGAGGGAGAGTEDEESALPKATGTCNGVFVSYDFLSRTKLFPHLKNATAQAWAFNSTARIINTGTHEVKAWKIFIGFQHKEILVSATGAALTNSEDFPANVENGTTVAGSGQADLDTSINTAGDMTKIQAKVQFRGTQFGVRPPGIPMPKTIKFVNDGYKCPAPTRKESKY